MVVNNVQHEATLKLAEISFVHGFVCSTQTQEGALGCSKQTESGSLSREFKLKCIWRHQIIGLCSSTAVENTLSALPSFRERASSREYAITAVYDVLGGRGAGGPHCSLLTVVVWKHFWEKEITLI